VLDAFAFGDEAAASLGVNVGRARMVMNAKFVFLGAFSVEWNNA
jgi:ABC-type Fe3+-siderophore transport system permease subunit